MKSKPGNNSGIIEPILADKWIEYLCDKYGVSKRRVILLMSALINDFEAIEAVLKRDRFVR